MLQYKNISDSIKDVDVKQGIISGYFASFDTKDSDGDIIVKGAFKKTLSEGIGRVKWFLNHNISEPVGVLKELYEDNIGLAYVGQVTGGEERRSNLIDWFQSGTITEHSHGFEPIKQKAETGANYILESKLWEGSSLTAWGANENTPVTSVKNLFENKKEYSLKSVNKYLKTIEDIDEVRELMTIFCLQQIKYNEELKRDIDELKKRQENKENEILIKQELQALLSKL